MTPMHYSADMPRRSGGTGGRLNIYVSRDLWRRVKQAAARSDLSVSEYCAQAIEQRLVDDVEAPMVEHARAGAVAAAKRFRAAHFGRKLLRVSTAELLREARENSER